MLYKNFSAKYITGVCRNCLNQASGLHLDTPDCIYYRKEDFCPKCGDYRHIVADLRRRGRLQVFFHWDKKK